MKKVVTTMALVLMLILGFGVAAFACDGNASVVSAEDSNGNPVTVTFTAEDMHAVSKTGEDSITRLLFVMVVFFGTSFAIICASGNKKKTA